VFNEEDMIGHVLESLPSFVDAVVVVDDGSTDSSYEKATTYQPRFSQFLLKKHARNMGFGAALKSCYINSLKTEADAIVLMGGDGQMYPGDLPFLLDPIVDGSADVVSGDRFSSSHGVCHNMPTDRFALNRLVTMMTSAITGYRIADAECGYSAMKRQSVAALDWTKMTNGWGIALERLLRLREHNFILENVPVRTIYRRKKSRLRYLPYLRDYISVSLRLLRLWLHFSARPTHGLRSTSKPAV
jgi:glycosyltransferase involved in cell wall biosynthesis